MTTLLKKSILLTLLIGALFIMNGCSDDDNDSPTDPINEFPTVQGITITPNAAVFVDDTIILSPVTTDVDNNDIRYTWSKNAGVFDPQEAVGESIRWTAPGTRGTYQVTVVADDANGGTSQKHLDIEVYGGNQTGIVDVVPGLRLNPVGGNINLGYVDAGDTITLVWDRVSPVTTDSTRPDETKYAPDGSQLDGTTLTVVYPPQFGFAEGLPVRDAARYSLIGKIGDNGSWFGFTGGPDTNADGIPDSFSVTAPARGKIYLSLNEQDGLLLDNTGFWRLDFTITHP